MRLAKNSQYHPATAEVCNKFHILALQGTERYESWYLPSESRIKEARLVCALDVGGRKK